MTIQFSAGVKTYEINSRSDHTELRRFLDDILLRHSGVEHYCFCLWDTVITRRMLGLLVKVLNTPLSTESMARDLKWYNIHFCHCMFAEPNTPLPDDDGIVYNEGDCCSLEDKELLAATLAGRTDHLELTYSTEVLDVLLLSPHLPMSKWGISESELSASQCARVGNLIERSGDLTYLMLDVPKLEDPSVLAQALANAGHLNEVYFTGQKGYPTVLTLPDRLFSGGWSSMGGRLVTGSLTRLTLTEIELEDSHFMLIVEMLPASRLESLCLECNNIGLQGFMAFAEQLPRLKYLKEVDLTSNQWDQRSLRRCQKCYAALAQGLSENYSMEDFRIRFYKGWQEEARIAYFTNLNHMGRRILVTSSPVPSGLWPLLLERTSRRRRRFVTKEYPLDPVQGIYFFLQSHPLQSLLAQSSRSLASHQESR